MDGLHNVGVGELAERFVDAAGVLAGSDGNDSRGARPAVKILRLADHLDRFQPVHPGHLEIHTNEMLIGPPHGKI